MDERKLRHATTQGVKVAVAFFAAAYGLSLLHPSEPAVRPALLVGPLVLGVAYAGFVYVDEVPVHADA